MQIPPELRATFAYVLILLALAAKVEPKQHNDASRGCPPVFFRKSMILILLLRTFVQESDSKRVALCAREVAEPTAREGADTGGVARSGAASVAR